MSGPLAGVRVLELARVVAGPYCGMILGDLGADVIKVERPGEGDDLRHWGPPFMADDESTYFLSVNRNKRSIAIDLKSPAGRDLLRRLIVSSDVLIENFKPGGLEALGLDHQSLAHSNPRLVHCSITAYGEVGPLRDRPGYDVMVQAMSGLMSVTGSVDGEPVRAGVPIVDLSVGMNAAIAVLAALVDRGRTGRGRRVGTSLLEVALALLPNLTAGYLMAGAVPERLGNGHPNAAPYGVFPTRDSLLVLAVGNDDQWQRLCSAMGEEELGADPEWATNGARIARRAAVDEKVAGWFRRFETAELAQLLARHLVPNGTIQSVPEALNDTQVHALGQIRSVQHPTSGEIRFVGSPIHLEETAPAAPAPCLDQHRVEILDEVLGLDTQQVEQLARGGAFGPGPLRGGAGE
ncbi:MAG: CaiB/BaiF CoA transferase family protein [Candidatus Dormibacteria bacterium]